MIRRKDLEYSWIFKASFWVNAYTATLKNGKTYIVYAHDFNDMEFFLTRLYAKEAGIMTVATDSDFVPYRKKAQLYPRQERRTSQEAVLVPRQGLRAGR